MAVQNLLARNRGHSLSANAVRRLTPEAVAQLLPEPNLALAVQSTLLAMRGQEAAIDRCPPGSAKHEAGSPR